MRLLVPALIVLGLTTGPARALAQRTMVALYYEVPGDASCPDESGFQARVGSRLGYVPFDDAAMHRARVTVIRVDGALEATLEFSLGAAPTSRTTRAGEHECEALVDALAWLLALAVDPDALAVPGASEPAMTPPVAPVPPVAASPLPEGPAMWPVVPVQPRPPREPVSRGSAVTATPADAFRAVRTRLIVEESRRRPLAPLRRDDLRTFGLLQLAGGPTVFLTPGVVGGVISISAVAVFDRTFEVRAGLAFAPPTGADSAGGAAFGMLFEGRIGVCALHESVVGGCLMPGVGAMVSWAGRAMGQTLVAVPHISLGARGIVRWWWTADLGAALELEVAPVLVRPELAFRELVAWTAPEVHFEAEIPFFLRFR